MIDIGIMYTWVLNHVLRVLRNLELQAKAWYVVDLISIPIINPIAFGVVVVVVVFSCFFCLFDFCFLGGFFNISDANIIVRRKKEMFYLMTHSIHFIYGYNYAKGQLR